MSQTLVKRIFLFLLCICLVGFELFTCCAVECVAESAKVIRIAWRERAHLNPLNTFDFSGEAVMPLVYRGLFFLDDRERLKTDLASEASWSPDHLSLHISLDTKAFFSDGSRLCSQDAALSILYRRYYLELERRKKLPGNAELGWAELAAIYPALEDPRNYMLDTADIPAEMAVAERTEDLATGESEVPEENLPAAFSPQEQLNYLNELNSDPDGSSAYAAIRFIEIIDEQHFVIHLSTWAERLPWYLCFAIIPASHVADLTLEPIPGCGRYRFAVSGRDIYLQAREPSAPKIQIVAFADVRAALYAFANGDLDLLLLDSELYPTVALRQDVHSVTQETLTYHFLLSGFSPDYLFSDPDLLKTFRSFLPYLVQDSVLGSHVPFAHRNSDWRRDYYVDQAYVEKTAEEWWEFRQRLAGQRVVLAAVSNHTNQELVQNIKRLFLSLGLEVEVKWLAEEDFETFAASGEYDFLLSKVDLSLPTDLRTLSKELRDLEAKLSILLPDLTAEGLLPPSFAYRWNIEQENIPLRAMQNSKKALGLAMKYSRVFEIGFAQQGLLVSHTVQGSINAPAWDPYRGIEALCPKE